MSSIRYDPSRTALYSPEQRETVFTAGNTYSDLQIGIEAARLAYLRAEQSTEQMDRLKDALNIVGFGTPALLHGEATKSCAFASYRGEDHTALIAFRGTRPDAVEDLITDVKVRLTDWPETGGRVHEGFALAFRALRPHIERWMSENILESGKIIFAGHSLGAALATLSAAVWKPALLLTLGSPRVGNAGFVDSLQSTNIARLVDCCDAITDVPFELVGYRHAGPALYISASGVVTADPLESFIAADRSEADLAYLKTHALKVTENVLLRRLADHAPINYVRAFF